MRDLLHKRPEPPHFVARTADTTLIWRTMLATGYRGREFLMLCRINLGVSYIARTARSGFLELKYGDLYQAQQAHSQEYCSLLL